MLFVEAWSPVEANEACAYHKERTSVTFCESCNRPICRECVLTDQVLPRFYFSFWSIPRYRFLCPSCYISWHESNVVRLRRSRIRRTALWLVALVIGFGFPLLARLLSHELFYVLPAQIVIFLLNAVSLLVLFSLVFLIPYFLLYIVILRKLSTYPKKARRIATMASVS
jgi:hypothetical protein